MGKTKKDERTKPKERGERQRKVEYFRMEWGGGVI